MYQCQNEPKCISKSLLCDGRFDCPWDDDELNCEKGLYRIDIILV